MFVCLFVCLLCVCSFYKKVVNIQRFSLYLKTPGEYSNVFASPLQNGGEYSKVLFVCLFVCLFVLQNKW